METAGALPGQRRTAQTPFVPPRGRGVSRYFASDPTDIRLSVSAIVWRESSGGRELLLMRRSDNGHWGLPGGYVEAGRIGERGGGARGVRGDRACGSPWVAWSGSTPTRRAR